jgi:hypothetical protein
MFCLISFKLNIFFVVPWGTMMTFMTLSWFNLYWPSRFSWRPYVSAFNVLNNHLVVFNALDLLMILCASEALVNKPSPNGLGVLHILTC